MKKRITTEPVEVVDDVAEARAMRDKAIKDLRDAKRRNSEVSRVVGYLLERRALNHFGDDLQITFTRRNDD